MLKKDFLIFFVIYMIFVIGFSQGKRNITLNQKIALNRFYNSLFFSFCLIVSAMFLVVSGYDDRAVDENLFTRWFAAGLGLIVLSLGEFEVRSCTRNS